MEAKVYINESFFDVFESFTPNTIVGSVDTLTENKNQLINILNNSQINSPISKKYFINLHKKLGQNYKPSSLKEYVFFRAFRNNKLKISNINLESPNSIFLLDKDLKTTNILCENNNIITKGIEYDFKSPITPKSTASNVVDKEMKGIDCIKHRSRNVIIIDPYLFEDQHNFEPKIPNLLVFLKELYLHNDNANCFLSIITNAKDNDRKINSKIKQIQDGIANTNLEISVYLHSEGLFKNNRHFITDYSIIDSQHLFDRDEASVSVSYFYEGNIDSNFLRVMKLKEKIISNFNKDPHKMGVFTRKFGNILNNPLFH